MAKSTNLLLFLSVTLLVANASWYETFTNNTKLRGKLNWNSSEGMNLDYKGKLGFDNGYVAVDLLDLGANFNAKPQAVEGQHTHEGSVAYSLGFNVDTNGHKAAVNVGGVAGAQIDVNCTNNTNTTNTTNGTKQGDYTVRLINTNTFIATGGDAVAIGGHSALVGLKGHVKQDGAHFTGNHEVGAFSEVHAVVTANETVVGAGSVGIVKNAKLDSHVKVGGKGAIHTGNGSYTQATNLTWNDHSRVYTKAGTAGWEGVSGGNWTQNGNGTQLKWGSISNIDYNHVGQIYDNNTKVADTLSAGTVTVAKGAGFATSGNGTWRGGAGNTGVWNQWTIGHEANATPNASVTSSSAFNSEKDENSNVKRQLECLLRTPGKSVEECKKEAEMATRANKKDSNNGDFVQHLKVQWVQHTGLNGEQQGDNHNINFDNKAGYHVNLQSLLDGDNWETHGNKTVSGSLTVHGNGNNSLSVDNLNLNFD